MYFVDENNEAKSNIIFKKSLDGKFSFNNPSKYLIDYLGVQGVTLKEDYFVKSKKDNTNESIESL